MNPPSHVRPQYPEFDGCWRGLIVIERPAEAHDTRIRNAVALHLSVPTAVDATDLEEHVGLQNVDCTANGMRNEVPLVPTATEGLRGRPYPPTPPSVTPASRRRSTSTRMSSMPHIARRSKKSKNGCSPNRTQTGVSCGATWIRRSAQPTVFIELAFLRQG